MIPTLIKTIKYIFYPEKRGTDEEYYERIVDEYRHKRSHYEEFCLVVYKIFDIFLKEHGYKYQITYRTKMSDRLKEKLIRKSSQGKRYASLEEIEDLAGLRVIFYSEKDKERFLEDIKDEISGSIRIEHKIKKSGYKAIHLIISFGSKRLRLSEYKKFKGLKSEVQVTSFLHHTWAEIEHDFIYKDINNLKERDPEKFAIMEGKLAEILEKYIKKASFEFEEIMKEISE